MYNVFNNKSQFISVKIAISSFIIYQLIAISEINLYK